MRPVNLNPSELRRLVIIVFQKSIVMKSLILFLYLQIVTEGANYYFVIFGKTRNMEKLLRKFIHSFYEKCLDSYQECKGSENLSYFHAKYVTCKFHGRFWQEIWYLWIKDKDIVTHSTASSVNSIIPPSALGMTRRILFTQWVRVTAEEP